MKLKHWQEVNNGKLHKQVKFPLFGQVKKDGVYALILSLPQRVLIFNRTSRLMQNVQALECELQSALFPVGIYLAELCNDQCSLEVLSGIVNPNRTKPLSPEQEALLPSMHLYLHDHLTIEEFKAGVSDVKYTERVSRMNRNLMMCPPGNYTQLPMTCIWGEGEVEAFANECIEAGEEGAVFKPETGWEAGHKGWRMMKWVREINYDLLCVGIEEGTGKYANKVANLILKWEGDNLIKAMLGKGWTHEDADRLFHGFCTKPIGHVDNPVNKVYRVRGLSDSSKGKIRLPKVMEERHDKTTGDF
ncbi:ATP-dependent DNA ligase [Pseudomonas phage Alpheus]|uniref:ATP-dependent DNA ligase n=1 Tax=Pseudomonas phage Alpheus TaxID=2163983 RepID=A0A2S1GMZ2_9CAUD|nr:ATP-dependent DNA ligase [Pseudomonas phage Alpheus]AWD90749.1 ATP-dependent DNA ligase [Pseudomonas phage Alpheus]